MTWDAAARKEYYYKNRENASHGLKATVREIKKKCVQMFVNGEKITPKKCVSMVENTTKSLAGRKKRKTGIIPSLSWGIVTLCGTIEKRPEKT